ncbi:aspartate aminotransferase [Nitzschia inconspicua]|uniref:aspartate transaminase n=1 Tax=Nitzschia inconspicua TaxID=303405 RepID=A0A9K3LMJ2_9STRA|nr:aspartate aminotransferase [Nitzschia inconspicua]
MILPSISRSVLRQHSKAAARYATNIHASRTMSTSSSPWSQFEMAPTDPIVGLNEIYNKDDFPSKVIVGVGAYRDDLGKPYVLPCVREAEQILMDKNLDMEYTGIAGEPKFVDLALKFVYGEDSVPIQENRVHGVQALSGTGGLRVFGELMAKHGHKHIYVPNPTWGNHIPIFTNSGLEVRKYRYYDAESSDLDFTNMMKDIKDIPKGSLILMHACAHNPTGMDPTMEQWKEMSETIKKQGLVPFFDCAYQGFASGDPVKDASSVRMFVEDGHLISMVQSFSKNFGLYGQRIGALSVVGADEDEAKRVVSQMKMVIRPMYSNPPRQGARIVTTILEDPRLTQDFLDQCRGMADRINLMRTLLQDKLAEAGSTKNWDHITKQIGMFAYSGLNKDQVMEMREKHHVYCTADGRISMAGVTSGNVDYIANAIHDVSK